VNVGANGTGVPPPACSALNTPVYFAGTSVATDPSGGFNSNALTVDVWLSDGTNGCLDTAQSATIAVPTALKIKNGPFSGARILYPRRNAGFFVCFLKNGAGAPSINDTFVAGNPCSGPPGIVVNTLSLNISDQFGNTKTIVIDPVTGLAHR